ncbi:MAG: gpW family head-tail joining protein [Alphaproteobacteria bacterium]|jgi:hypothetical protein
MTQDKATLQKWLNDAEAALQELTTGLRPVTVAYGGNSVTYTAADETALRRRISELRMQLGLGSGRRPILPYF